MERDAATAKGHLGKPEAARGRKDSPLEHPERVWPCDSLVSDFRPPPGPEGINVCCFKPPVNGPLKLSWGQQSSGGHLEEEGGRLSCLGGPSPSPGSCWEGSHLSPSPQGDVRHPLTSPGLASAGRCVTPQAGRPWQQIILIFSIKGAKARSNLTHR